MKKPPATSGEEREVKLLFWKWLKENHPIAHEVVWWIVDLVCVISIIISVVVIRMR